MNNTLPPANSLPHWSRMNVLDKVYFPKQLSKEPKIRMEADGRMNYVNEDIPVVSEVNPSQRAQQLERNMVFLQQQHAEVLKALQDEVDSLKKENKDLHFKIVVSQKLPTLKEDADATVQEPGKTEEMKIIFLEEEVKELKRALRETRNKNQYLSQLLQQEEKQKEKTKGKLESPHLATNYIGTVDSAAPPVAMETAGQPMNLAQCHAYIKHLQLVNDKQSHELKQLKLDLRDVLYSHKWTPDAFLMAKAYVAEDERKEEGTTLPRIPLRNPTKKIPEIAYLKENISLPALHLTVGNKAIERKKRTQILQKSKLRPGALP